MPAVTGDEHVAGLDVTVHEAAGVCGVERRADLGDDPRGAVRREPALGVDQRPQILTLHVAHDDEQQAVDLVGLVDRDDMAVIDRGGHARLALEAGAELDVRRQRRGDHLQRDRAREAQLCGPVDDAHAAVPDQLLDAVTTELVADLDLSHGLVRSLRDHP